MKWWRFAILHWRVLLAVIIATLRPLVPREVRAVRRRACEECPGRDVHGQPLYRLSGGLRTCGAPLWQMPERDPSRDGCGCLLNVKWRYSGVECPQGRWPKA